MHKACCRRSTLRPFALAYAPSKGLTGLPPSNFDQTIQISKGSADGVAVGYPVTDGSGLVGRVIDVSKHRAVVRLITDPDFFAGVSLPTVPELGIVNGHGRGNLLTLDLIDANAPVKKDAIVITSGVPQSLFPANIPVGLVSEFHKEPGALQLTVKVEPAADLTHLGVVKVIVWKPEN